MPNTFFNNSRAAKKPALTRNQYGGALGGPIIGNKLFFFTGYEGYKQRRGIWIPA